MVATRRQLALAGARPVVGTDAIDRIRRSRRWIKRYKPSDVSKRHRLSDSQPKTEHVVSYTRRK